MRISGNLQTTHLKSICSALCLLLLISLTPRVHVTALGDGAQANANFCANLSNRQKSFQNRFTAKQSALTAKWQGQTARLESLVAKQDAAISKARANTDSQRALNQTALMNKAKTADKKTAVTAYGQAIAGAVQSRRNAVDAARTTFRNGVKTLLANRQAAVAGRVTAFQISVNDAFTTAAGSCTDNTDGSTVRSALLQSIATAKQAFESQRTSDTTTNDLQALITARNQAIQAANNTFQQATQTARQALKTAFGDNAGAL